MEFINFIFIIILMIMVAGLKTKIEEFESLLRGSKQKVSEPEPVRPEAVAVQPVHMQQSPMSMPKPVVPVRAEPVQQYVDTGPDAIERALAWLVHDWPLKAGAFLFLLGFGWFSHYAYSNDWIGPQGVIAVGLIFGTIVMTAGYLRMTYVRYQGVVLHLLGATMIAITVYAARSFYNMFTPDIAMIMLLATSASIAFTSAIQNIPRLAICGLVLAGAVPFLVGATGGGAVYLLGYILGVTVVYLLLSLWMSNVELTFSAFIMSGLYSFFAMAGAFGGDMSVLVVFGFLFGVAFLIASTNGLQRERGERAQPYMIIACLNALLVALWIFFHIGEDARALTFLAWSFVYAYIGFIVSRLRGVAEPFYVNIGLSSVFLVLATMMQFEGVTLAAVLLLECVVIIFGTAYLSRNVASTEKSMLSVALPLFFSLLAMMGGDILSTTTPFLSYGIFAVSLLLLGFSLPSLLETSFRSVQGLPVLVVIGTLYAALYVWTTAHLYLSYETGTVIALFIYAIAGVIAYVTGVLRRDAYTQHFGTVILLCLVARLLLIDIATMDLLGKILTFTGVGVLFISASFISRSRI